MKIIEMFPEFVPIISRTKLLGRLYYLIITVTILWKDIEAVYNFSEKINWFDVTGEGGKIKRTVPFKHPL